MRSQTINGLLLAAVGLIFNTAGAPLAEGELETVLLFVGKAAIVGGWVWAYIGRLAKGDLKILGGRKVL